MTRTLAVLIASMAAVPLAFAEQAHQPYKGFETRVVTSLSQEDIKALQEGSGWGLALPAELNGFPGPAHVLELADELGLSADQTRRISTIFKEMRADAIEKGAALIDAERKLDQGFRAGSLTAIALKRLIADAEAARAELRYVHLSRHLMMMEHLDADQVTAYASLRGYGADPCATAPDGHDATMWRQHNGCTD